MPPALAELLEVFELIEDRSERIQLLIDTADRYRLVPAEVATPPYDESHRVPNCESEAFAWAVASTDAADALDFHFAVENPQGISAMAMAAILQETCSGAPLEQVAGLSSDIPLQLFGRELSFGKNMGLMGMVSMVANYARKAQKKTEEELKKN
jgi:cysteine desulfuration protein SufE